MYRVKLILSFYFLEFRKNEKTSFCGNLNSDPAKEVLSTSTKNLCKNSIIRAEALVIKWCRGRGSNPYDGHPSQDFKSCASANSATPARLMKLLVGPEGLEPPTNRL
jgi:hypothetical protein